MLIPMNDLLCPNCGNTLVEKAGDYYQCVSSGEGHYEGNNFVLDYYGCGYVGELEEFQVQTKIKN